ncbi:MAG: ribosomal-processing cysteine protease Prp [Treponema sp.]|jgi:uncharacterized protein YsxB (DUF464 family)|nr:ribosomal-processing cysteine protease Prp [Treponema sp.]
MIKIDAVLDETGLFRACKVWGHAGAGPKGGDIVCAAVSVLTKTAFTTLSSREGIMLRGGAPERGIFWMETDYSGAGREFLAGAGAFLMEGLKSVAELYPEHCRLNIHMERRN